MTDYKIIWLSAVCEECQAHAERFWCEDDAFDPCEACGRTASRYVLDEAYDPMPTTHECVQCGENIENGTIPDGCRDPDCPEQKG